MQHDSHLARWSGALFWLAILTVLICLSAPLALWFGDVPIALAKGAHVWSANLNTLPAIDKAFVLTVLLAPQCAWVAVVIQVGLLARNFRRGMVFENANARRFLHIGTALTMMGVLQALVIPLIGYWLYHRGLCPWLPDMALLSILEPDLIMAGIFFFVLGKIMKRGVELQETETLTI